MVEVKRGRGRPRKNPVGVFKLEEPKRPVGRPPKKKRGRPVGSKNKPKTRTVEDRLQVLEWGMNLLVDAVTILGQEIHKKKAR